MAGSEEGRMLCVYLGEEDVWNGTSLSQAIVRKAHELGLAAAVVRRGNQGYGASRTLRTDMIGDVPSYMPVVIEIADTPANVGRLLPFLEEMVAEGLITLQPVRLHRYPPDNR